MIKQYLNKFITSILLHGICFILIISCTKTPASTLNTAQNSSIYFTINEVNYITNGWATISNGTLKINGSTSYSPTKQILLYLKTSTIGTYILNSSEGPQGNGNTGTYTEGVAPFGLTVFSTDASNIGSVTISKFDMINKVVSGTFYFDATQISPLTGGGIKISNGSFNNIPINE